MRTGGPAALNGPKTAVGLHDLKQWKLARTQFYNLRDPESMLYVITFSST